MKIDRYSQEMKAKPFDIEAGKLISVIHEIDAKELGVFPLDRIEITNRKNGKHIVTVVDTTTTMVRENEIGLFKDVQKALGIKKGQGAIVRQSPQPESVALIKKKIKGEALSAEEINEIVQDIAYNKLSEVEASAFMTAAYIQGYDLEETAAMTRALIADGRRLKLKRGAVLDKHSIGGVNGRTTMVIVPIVAAAGCMIPKTSSRSITSAAGTADSMEVLAKVSLPIAKIKKITEKIGGVIAWGGAVELAPADDKIIKIEHPLSLDPEGQVIASVLAKKASVGAQFVVIDLPVGPDMKVNSLEKAEEMAKKFVEIGKRLGMKVEAVITNGAEPCGKTFGAALEAKSVLEILEGKKFDNMAQKSCELAGTLLELAGKTPKGTGFKVAREILQSGKALKKMQEIIKAQGAKILESKKIPRAKFTEKITAEKSGKISGINVRKLIDTARTAGAPVHKLAGLELFVEKGQEIKKGTVLFEIHSENKQKLGLAKKFALESRPIEFGQTIIEKIA
ncbi:MAG TPA: AMP phosphorylase [archaeon]|uniref:AMP phosphorylase n=1 Tax=uncultured Nanobdellati archaeon TaxID=2219213 RepID=A0A447IU04_9ARCH|nr:AMP phosphorylase [uncultured DPANN archaeon]HLD58729.1 AMP phosphorylase [archaeon]